MPEGINLYIERELAAGTLKLSAYKNSMFVGCLIGYHNHRAGTVKCFPYKNILRGIFKDGDFPFFVRFDELEWENRRSVMTEDRCR